MLAAEESRHEEFKKAPELEQVVFDGCSGETKPELGLDLPDGTRGDRVGVLDVLRFVQDDRVEFILLEFLHVAPEESVGRQHQM